jgi:hypothetical protein
MKKTLMIAVLASLVGCSKGASTKVQAPAGWTATHETDQTTGKVRLVAKNPSTGDTVELEVLPKPADQSTETK